MACCCKAMKNRETCGWIKWSCLFKLSQKTLDDDEENKCYCNFLCIFYHLMRYRFVFQLQKDNFWQVAYGKSRRKNLIGSRNRNRQPVSQIHSSIWESKLFTNDLSFSFSKVVITNCSPFVVIEDFKSSASSICSCQSDLWITEKISFDYYTLRVRKWNSLFWLAGSKQLASDVLIKTVGIRCIQPPDVSHWLP